MVMAFPRTSTEVVKKAIRLSKGNWAWVTVRTDSFIEQNAIKAVTLPPLGHLNSSSCTINVASINGISPGIFQGIYSVTKAAVINMTKVFAKECAQFGIRCNALLPGLTDTKFASALVKNDAMLKTALAQIPLKRVADPSEMAGAVLYLASDASSYTTGVSLNVDGGFLS
ncbi:SDR family oxidoreductase [Pseudomonas sp. PDM02]|uniref:SDR family oxidoreductase n=1 Tax=Pseudomonas sp. PDM02 TaxID=2769267 RepID=UPI00298C5D99|nr:SDR family oxidoreductase [Pseudomonas sp. PDM02]